MRSERYVEYNSNDTVTFHEYYRNCNTGYKQPCLEYGVGNIECNYLSGTVTINQKEFHFENTLWNCTVNAPSTIIVYDPIIKCARKSLITMLIVPKSCLIEYKLSYLENSVSLEVNQLTVPVTFYVETAFMRWFDL